ncbi:MAG: aldehyde dehydrogenase (NADP(+)) [Rhodothermales bacterium]|nr:aldehyde dehydrogenase (NADP(+)) [Rhodothermales bacterium]MBO6778922.1 aldehyde dehydrogenase (NADP(+)) [Rhodothermales bacterium]
MATTITLQGCNLIGDADSSEGRAAIAGVNPKDGRPLAPFFHEATQQEISRAVHLAREAFESDSGRGPGDRADLLEAIADEIEGLGDVLVDRVQLETGLPEGRVRGERGRTCGQLRMFAGLLREGSWQDARIETALPDRSPMPRPDIRTISVPLGPVAVFGASNFPLAFSVAGGDTASALAAGCPVVCKAHPAHPGTSELVGRAVNQAVRRTGFHAGTFSLLHGAGAEVGQQLVNHQQIAAVGFTGSLAAGRSLFDAANSRPHPIPVYAEMGSVNPVFVMAGALQERGGEIADGLAGSVTLGSGQFCTNPGLVFVEQSPMRESFVNALRTSLEQAGPQIMLHAGLASGYAHGVQKLGDTAGVTGGSRANPGGDGAAVATPALFLADLETFKSNPHLHEEVFGPSTVVVLCDAGKLADAAGLLDGNLTGTIHCDSGDDAGALMTTLSRRVGRVIFNGFPTGVEVCHAMHHGGPYPATTAPSTTSVGTAAVRRWVRPVCFQNSPDELLPEDLRDENPRGILRLVNGEYSRDAIAHSETVG